MQVADRRYHKRQLEAMQMKVSDVADSLTLAIRELADDDHDATEDVRARLAEARTAIAAAGMSLEDALNQLPRPVALTQAERDFKELRYPLTPLASRAVQGDDVEGHAKP